MNISTDQVLNFLRQYDRPLQLTELHTHFNIPRDESTKLSTILTRLKKQGKVTNPEHGLWAATLLPAVITGSILIPSAALHPTVMRTRHLKKLLYGLMETHADSLQNTPGMKLTQELKNARGGYRYSTCP